jgi:hypothetical protein
LFSRFTHPSPNRLFFMRIPADIATCLYYTGIDPFTKEPVTVAKGMASSLERIQEALAEKTAAIGHNCPGQEKKSTRTTGQPTQGE